MKVLLLSGGNNFIRLLSIRMRVLNFCLLICYLGGDSVVFFFVGDFGGRDLVLYFLGFRRIKLFGFFVLVRVRIFFKISKY